VKAYPLVMIEWVDSMQPASAWAYLSDPPALAVVHCKSVGWLVGETADVKMLAPNLGNLQDSENAQGSGFMRIPTACVTKETTLVEAV
jgi:hypothetical protein